MAITSLNLTVKEAAVFNAVTPRISLSISSSAAAWYGMDVSSDGVALFASSFQGLVAATTTMLQALEYSSDKDSVAKTVFNCSTDPEWRVPFLAIRDKPEFEYRGLMVDAARNFLSLADLKKFVVTAQFYKLNYLHLHLTDDQAFTFPSTSYPALASKSFYKVMAHIAHASCCSHGTLLLNHCSTLFQS
jgi:hexosaminidase